MTVKDSLYGQTKTYTNKAYQVDFGNGYETKEVTNTLVSPEPKKQNLNKDKVDINGKPMLVGTQNYYTLSWDLDQYRGLKLTTLRLHKDFTLWMIIQKKLYCRMKQLFSLSHLMENSFRNHGEVLFSIIRSS